MKISWYLLYVTTRTKYYKKRWVSKLLKSELKFIIKKDKKYKIEI